MLGEKYKSPSSHVFQNLIERSQKSNEKRKIPHCRNISKIPHCRNISKVQNTAARLITRKRKYDSITPVLISLHWLPPVHYRCQYKLLTYVYKAQHGKAPSYLQELITSYKPNRALRSENSMLLHPPNDVRAKSYGERRFDKAAPTLWTSLPLSLRNVNSLDVFKRELKTHFFRIAFKNFLQIFSSLQNIRFFLTDSALF